MPTPYTHKKLTEVNDSAPDLGFAEAGEARFGGEELEAQQTGFSHYRLKPGAHPGFGHRHQDAEEVYVVLSGSGRMKLDDDIIEIGQLDVVRVAPEVWRSFSSGDEGLEVLAFGARHDGDGEVDYEWWSE